MDRYLVEPRTKLSVGFILSYEEGVVAAHTDLHLNLTIPHAKARTKRQIHPTHLTKIGGSRFEGFALGIQNVEPNSPALELIIGANLSLMNGLVKENGSPRSHRPNGL